MRLPSSALIQDLTTPEKSMTPEEFAKAADVSRETMDVLLKYDAAFIDASSRHNLVARSTIEDRWSRHYLDSAQLFKLIPAGTKHLVDLGSGAGFPGLILAALGSAHGLKVTLIESTGKKAAFLAEAGKAMGLDNIEVMPQRIEQVKVAPPEIITARALASLDKLCAYGAQIAGRNTTFLYMKGSRAEDELTEALKSWRMDVACHPSVTDKTATIFEIKNLVSRRPATRK